MLCSAALLVASAYDLVEREVPDEIWLLAWPSALFLTGLWLAQDPDALVPALISILVSLFLAALIYYTGLMGGADAKALVLIALAFPINGPWALLNGHPFVPLATFSNALALSALLALSFLALNLAWRARSGLPLFEGIEAPLAVKVLVLLTGLKMRSEDILSGGRHFFPLEVVDEDGSRRISLILRVEELYGRLEGLKKALKEGLLPDYIWASPGLPMVVFISAGFLLAIFIGDLVFLALVALLSVLI